MHRYMLVAALSLWGLMANAQVKHDAVWLFGSPSYNVPGQGGTKLVFEQGQPIVSYFEIPIDFEAISMVSDSTGQLAFYTNGCEIRNGAHLLVANSDSLNAGEQHESYCDSGYPPSQGIMTLPKPGHPGAYGLFHIRLDDDLFFYTDLLYSEVDGLANGGQGGMNVLNQPVFQDTLGNNLSAVRHANGRDWWIITAKNKSNLYYITYYGPEGPGETYVQSIGPVWDHRYWSGQSTFSPDGRHYIRMNPFNGLHVFDFDRCAGELSNARHIEFPNDTIVSAGAAVSPNNRYLYVAASLRLYQFDLEAEDIAASKQEVAFYDGFTSPLSTRFFMLMLAPNGKIYGTASTGTNVLHVIHYPNEPGLACNVEQHGLDLLTYHSFATPNFPHFRLWDDPDSACDTLGIDPPVVGSKAIAPRNAAAMQVFPNPVQDQLQVNFGVALQGQLRLYDLRGVLLLEATLRDEVQWQWPTHSLPSGLYVLRYEGMDGAVESQKVRVE